MLTILHTVHIDPISSQNKIPLDMRYIRYLIRSYTGYCLCVPVCKTRQDNADKTPKSYTVATVHPL